MYTIEKGIPLPNFGEFPLDRLEIGDSFLIPACKQGALRHALRKLPKCDRDRFKTRKVREGRRVWRVS
jgi:hypothetical protein